MYLRNFNRDPPSQLHKTAALQLKFSVSPYPPLEVHKAACRPLVEGPCLPALTAS
ncbi:hypothetical protein BDV98DRAFT_568193 [Pterulicium gracile]|uniref:Uncharacterized protein n=1 Tax=Pterulicium gracile TaxID=1884261 RepID=A0A5C3QFW2_9AGAR|nr:hypothetical protein BDV98DRAFT_568193 [Pterula gracilis]